MIRISICFLVFFTPLVSTTLWAQEDIEFHCYNLDSIGWTVDFENCPDARIDSFQILTRPDPDSDFNVRHTSYDSSLRGYREEALKSEEALVLRYFVSCPQPYMTSDTLSLSQFREPVQLQTTQVLANGNVELTWEEKSINGIRYVVNAAVGGSSQVLATNLRESRYTDSRGLAHQNIEYYSISAVLDCGYTIPEPDSFFHTSHLTMEVEPCGGAVSFDLIPYSYWNMGTATATLFVVREGEMVDSLEISPGVRTFTYDPIENDKDYTFYVRETGQDRRKQIALSNPISIHTDFYVPIDWITIDDFSFDESNRASMSWKTNEHLPDHSFQLSRNHSLTALDHADLTNTSIPYRYGLDLNEIPDPSVPYRIELQDSCGNEVQSLEKSPIFTSGQLSSDNNLHIQWTDVEDEEWRIEGYEIYARTQNTYNLLGSANAATFQFSHSFDPEATIDSVCYYITAFGEVVDPAGSGPLQLRSNTVCLFGETIVEIPNAHSSYQGSYKPIVVPKSNLSSYVLRIFDRYGSLVFESHDPERGWDGQYQGGSRFSDVFVVQVKITNNQGEAIEKTGSLILFP